MNVQETVDRDVRLALGDMQLQLIIARAQIAELQQQLAATQVQVVEPVNSDVIDALKSKMNGKGKEAPTPGG